MLNRWNTKASTDLCCFRSWSTASVLQRVGQGLGTGVIECASWSLHPVAMCE
jgi:hypothetical protein